MGNKKQHVFVSGFTMIELAISLLIIGVIFGTIMMSGNQRTTTNNRVEQEDRFTTIRKALKAYRIERGALPCPGKEDISYDHAMFGVASNSATLERCDLGTNNTAARSVTTHNDVFCGSVPTVTLGIDKKNALDVYNRKITYCVTGAATNPCWWSGSSGTLGVPDNGHFKIQDASPQYIGNVPLSVLISHGENGQCAYNYKGTRVNAYNTNTYELANAACSANTADNILSSFIVRVMRPTGSGVNSFDDEVEWQDRLFYMLPGETGGV